MLLEQWVRLKSQRLYGNEWSIAKNQITKLIESSSVQQQIQASVNGKQKSLFQAEQLMGILPTYR